MIRTLMTICLVAGLSGVAAAQETPAGRVITVTGQSIVSAAPDMASITLGVTEQAESAAAAMSATSEAVSAILERLAAAGIEPRDMQTSGLSLNPVWSNRGGNAEGAPGITGYEASNTVTARVRDLSGLGDLLDAVVQNGANTLNGLAFDVQDPKPLESEARKGAVKDAMDRAAELAGAAGVTLGQVRTINEYVQRAQPMMRMADEAAPSAVPIAQGEVSFQGSVEMVFTIAD
ncbi:SIMPL domain-containing protein [Sulfitobacter sp. LCG007]